ncbi:PAS and ANTAR domain-containing protein [Krasilnikoviella flava]|uniref:PAS and ANTAR domain-containing protein n=1 Tax=Krasilnikoviella flava TaxID=526729 RepID=UPI00158FE9A4|nr:PAS and ANTAR domain-containing protein [Krasilnikoviella flava]
MSAEPSGLRSPRLVGSYRLDLASGLWTWSDAVYLLHGFEPHEVVPTTDLVLAHTHPEDRDDVRVALTAARAGGAFSSVHRVVTARRRELTVALVGSVRTGAETGPDEATGFFLDLTAAVAERARDRAAADIRAAATSRGVIEQAKGVLSVVYDVEIDGAFELMRTASNDHNVAVRELSRVIVDVAHRRDVDRRAALDLVLGGGRG